MSMILDALRKADSEREHGSVPGLHSQPVSSLALEEAQPSRTLPWQWIAIGLLSALVIGLVWFVTSRESQRSTASIAAAESAATHAAATNPAAVPAPAAIAPSADRSLEVAEAAPWPQPEARSAPAKSAAPASASARPASPPAGGATPPEAVVYAREQLPEAIRAALPALAFGGSMYSNNPANRSLVVNGGLYRENDQLTAELQLEQIKPKAAVFRFRGYRFEVPY